jgi:hypothetical protein
LRLGEALEPGDLEPAEADGQTPYPAAARWTT